MAIPPFKAKSLAAEIGGAYECMPTRRPTAIKKHGITFIVYSLFGRIKLR